MKKNVKMTRLAQTLRTHATKEENTLWYQYLRSYPVQFRRQCVFDRYIVDFYCAKAQLVIEMDGSQHYEPTEVQRDEARTQYLESRGLRVLRFTNSDVNKNLAGVCQSIDEVIKECYLQGGAVRRGRRD